jgi:choline dehydrogenase-like flavoprotein
MADPLIDAGYPSDPRDLATMIAGARIARQIVMTEPLRRYCRRELFGGREGMDEAQWEAMIRQRADTIYHPVGTCRMGEDQMAVVDAQLRVHGLQGLRGGCVGDAHAGQRQHQCTHHHDCREGGRHDPRQPGACRSGLTPFDHTMQGCIND